MTYQINKDAYNKEVKLPSSKLFDLKGLMVFPACLVGLTFMPNQKLLHIYEDR